MLTQTRKPKRKESVALGTTRTVKQKFLAERQESITSKPLVPMNAKQKLYMELLREKAVVVATGYAGTSKSYTPTVMASDLYKLGSIHKIYVTRPAISSSKSVGFLPGTATEKMSMWLGAVVPIFKERLGSAAFEIALEAGDIEFVPLEVVKGMSINDAWLICEEASDLTKEEVIKLITRMGKNSTLVLAGDIRQSELKETSGLKWLSDFITRNNLGDHFGSVDFNDVDDIVRSKAVKQFIISLVREEKQASGSNNFAAQRLQHIKKGNYEKQS